MAAQLTMAARVPCACSSSSSSPRLGAAQRAAARHRPATALLRQRAAGGLRAASRRQLGCVRAVLDVGDADFEQEVLKVRGGAGQLCVEPAVLPECRADTSRSCLLSSPFPCSAPAALAAPAAITLLPSLCCYHLLLSPCFPCC
jgi:hypothetical protein